MILHPQIEKSKKFGKLISAGSFHTEALCSDGTVVATEVFDDEEYHFCQCDVSSWKLFNNADNYEEECLARIKEELNKLN